MDYDTELLFPREKTGRDHNVRNMSDHGKVIKVMVDETQVSVICQILDKDGMVTKPLPVKQFGSRSTGAFWCPKEGDDVSITFYPNSETGDGCVDGSFYNTSNPPPTTDPNRRHITHVDETVIEYIEATEEDAVRRTDKRDGLFNISSKFPATIKLGNITIECGQITIKTPKIILEGDVDMEGKFTLDGIVINTHKHDKVEPGDGTTGEPVN